MGEEGSGKPINLCWPGFQEAPAPDAASGAHWHLVWVVPTFGLAPPLGHFHYLLTLSFVLLPGKETHADKSPGSPIIFFLFSFFFLSRLSRFLDYSLPTHCSNSVSASWAVGQATWWSSIFCESDYLSSLLFCGCEDSMTQATDKSNWRLVYSFRGWLPYPHGEGTTAGGQARCWKGNWELLSYPQVGGKQRDSGPGVGFWYLKAHP